MIFAISARIKPMTLPAAQSAHQSPASSPGPPTIAGRCPPNALARLRVLLLGALAGAAAGCGFQLQGAGVLPEVVATTYVEVPHRFTEFHLRLTDALTSRGVELTESRDEAGAVLRILEYESGQRVLSVSARNTPQEYEVFYAVGFSLEAGGAALIDNEFLVATRSYSYDPTQVLGMSAEEQVLREALAEDLARRVLRRIEGVQPAATAALISQ
ncbi:MAG: hypothetical protein F4053_17010 [Proteobacteria bacterium]|nr:hypothetical protein [Pseudomonadota bacterium]